MDLVSRARAYVQNGTVEEGDAILRDCLADGGAQALAAVQLLAEDMYGGETFNFELKAPHAVALLRWGEQGLDALVEMATRSPTTKNVSLCMSLLAAVAVGSRGRLDEFVRDPVVRQVVENVVAGNDLLRRSAHERLTSYVLALKTEADAVEAVAHQLWRVDDDLAPARELFAALAARWLAVSHVTLREFETLFRSSPHDEPAFQHFFEANPQLLDPAAMTVWAQPTIVGAKSPDFVVRRTDNTYLVIEIETPGKRLVTSGEQLSSEATHAVTQALDYRTFLGRRFELARSHFPEFQEPDCVVIVGLERELTEGQRAALARANQGYHALRVVGFDWILQRAAAVARNVTTRLTTEPRIQVR